MQLPALIAGIALVLLALFDAFETILQPRRVTHRFRFARFYYRLSWRFWLAAHALLPGRRLKLAFLSTYGPFSLLGLFASWIVGLILGFACVNFGAAVPLAGNLHHNFTDFLYMSGTTFFTLGYGDVTPNAAIGRTLAVCESGLGFAFLAVVISYLPVLYQAYSARELVISMMDARAGSPPSAAQVLLRLARAKRLHNISDLLAAWERWSAELLESHLSFPVLSYYRSQHDNQSWLAVLTTILDTCSLLISHVKSEDLYQVQVTFAAARHAAVDLALILKASPENPTHDRFPAADLARLRDELQSEAIPLRDPDARLAELRATYEPFLEALARRLLLQLPTPIPTGPIIDNWQRSSLGRAPSLTDLGPDDEHF